MPYTANLITKVKIEGINPTTIYNSIEKLKYNIKKYSNIEIELFEFSNINKWFRKDVIKDLSMLRKCIMLETDEKNRKYFWVCLSDLIRKYSNTRSSTFKLHIKEHEKIERMENNLISDFLLKINEHHSQLIRNNLITSKIIQGDSTEELKKMEDASIDLICTSPPYGDNGTTVTYGQYSMLSLLWIDCKDLEVSNESLLSNYSSIDTNSLGGKSYKSVMGDSSQYLGGVLEEISKNKQGKVKKFFDGYFLTLQEMIRVLKKDHLMVLTLGNRRVDKVEILLDDITENYCLQNGMSIEAKINRAIPRKKMPRKISLSKEQGTVSSMNKETILILRKGEI